MYAGHFAVALALKAREPRAPTWALLVGAALYDFLLPVFLLLRVEQVHLAEFTFIDWSHSLVMAIGWSVAFALLFRARGAAVAAVIGVAVFSHWVLDLLVHAPDLAFYPHSALHFGLNGGATTAGTVLEFALVLGCGATYLVAARKQRTFGRHAAWSVALLLALTGLRAFLQR